MWAPAITATVGILGALVGVLIGAWLTSRREIASRKHAFISKQLQDFYSPLLGLRNEIRARSELRVRVGEAANDVWQRLVEDARQSGGIDAVQRLNAERFPEFKRLIEWDNSKLYSLLLPAYQKMIEVFRSNLWLADTDTRQFFAELVEFVEVWERFRDKAIPGEVIEAIKHGESKLHPFYDHLESKVTELRTKLKDGRA